MPIADANEQGLAKLLGLTLKEYRELKHSPLMDIRNNNGVIIGYFMHINPQNSQALLDKLGITHCNFIRFGVKEITKLLKKEK